MKTESKNKTILITVLNWGLGHASRCIPIIKTIQSFDFTPIIASDGQALQFLKKEFPHLLCLELPCSNIKYPRNGKYFRANLILKLPKIAMTNWKEKKIISGWIKEYSLDGIISDNRMGCYSNKIPSVYMTHQINLLTGNTTWISTLLHQYFIRKFSECWVPDLPTEPNLAGKLSHIWKKNNLKLIYIGPISRLQSSKTKKKYDLMIILSGPEPQRTLLEIQLIKELQNYNGHVLFVKGIVENIQRKDMQGNITYYNFIKTEQMNQLMQESELVLCRSGYSTIMDLAKLNKKAFLIPTPGQYEQLYLAEKLQHEGLAPYSQQKDFKLENLNRALEFKGFSNLIYDVEWRKILTIFD